MDSYEERYERASECRDIEHLCVAVECDMDDKLLAPLYNVDGETRPREIPYERDPFFRDMDSLPDPKEDEIQRILNSDREQITYDDMVGVDDYD